MKKLGNLKINPEKLMKNDELMVLKGGEGIYIYCNRPFGTCMYPNAFSCDSWYVADICNSICSGWESSICVGY